MSVANRIKSTYRYEQLTWTHHREVAKLKAKEQEYFLNEAGGYL